MNKERGLLLAAAVVIIAAGSVFYLQKSSSSSSTGTASAEIVISDNQLQIASETLGKDAVFVDYDSGETGMQIVLYKDPEGTVHGAFNTCQVCNGSPYAYFEQDGNDIVCQNCGNHFALQEIGTAQGGCNPIPLEFTQEEIIIKIETAYLNQNAQLFKNWKQGI